MPFLLFGYAETTVVITAIKLYYSDGTIGVLASPTATPSASPQQIRRRNQKRRQLLQTVVGVEVSYSVSTPVVSNCIFLADTPTVTLSTFS